MAENAFTTDYIRINTERDIKLFFEDRFKAHERERRRLNNPNHKLQLIVCCMPRKDSKMYSTIKYYAGKIFNNYLLVEWNSRASIWHYDEMHHLEVSHVKFSTTK